MWNSPADARVERSCQDYGSSQTDAFRIDESFERELGRQGPMPPRFGPGTFSGVPIGAFGCAEIEVYGL
jgi:hypothetical protein